MPHKRYIIKDGVLVEESMARLLGIDGEVVEQWINDGDLAAKVLSLSPEQAQQVRDAIPD